MVIPIPLVAVLFQRGATGMGDSAAIALAVAIYGLGLPSFVLQKVFQPLYFAREDTRSPFRYAFASMLVNAALAIGLAPFIGWIAPAIATTVAGWSMALQLFLGSRKMGEVASFDSRFYTRLWRICAASAVMGLALWGGQILLTPLLAQPWVRGLALVLLLVIGILSYGIAGQLLGAFRLSEIRSLLRRRGKKDTTQT